ncbi:MAG: cupin domain-containing protein [Pseudomonadales bacterium]|nr:cupin domain-containing protein [Pseudomonadales bacterium]
MGHFTIPAGQTIRAVCHKTVDEIWYVLTGTGQMWRKHQNEELVVSLCEGVSVTIPVGTSFQVRNTGVEDLRVVGQTMPAWPGNDEATIVTGRWSPTLKGGYESKS